MTINEALIVQIEAMGGASTLAPGKLAVLCPTCNNPTRHILFTQCGKGVFEVYAECGCPVRSVVADLRALVKAQTRNGHENVTVQEAVYRPPPSVQKPEYVTAPVDDDVGLWEGPEFDGADFPEPEWLAKGLIPKGMLSMICADPKVGKSVMAHGLCIAAATGGLWLGEAVAKTNCLYINWEDPPGLTRDRARRQMEGQPLPRGYFVKEPPFGRSLEEMRPWLVRKIRELKIGLVVLDPLAIAARWREEKDPFETGVVMSNLQEIAVKCETAVVVVHHSTKSGGEWGKEVRGSGGIFGAVMSLLSIKRRTDGIFDLDLINKLTGDAKHSLSRNVNTLSWEITERVDAEGNPMSGVQINREENQEKCLAAIRAEPSIEIKGIIAATSLGEATVRRCVKELIRARRVMEGAKMNQDENGRRPRGHWAYPEPEDER